MGTLSIDGEGGASVESLHVGRNESFVAFRQDAVKAGL